MRTSRNEASTCGHAIDQASFDPPLSECGIHTDASDISMHVSVVNQTIYVFPTHRGRAAIDRVDPSTGPTYRAGVDGTTTAGYLIPLDDIENLGRVKFRAWPRWDAFLSDLSPSEKQRLAVRCVRDALKIGRFPVSIHTDHRRKVQRSGVNILRCHDMGVSVKCDYDGGEKPAGTGNLYLQFAEWAPG